MTLTIKGLRTCGNAAANNWQNDTASHTRRLRSSAIPLRDPQSPQDILKILPQAQRFTLCALNESPSVCAASTSVWSKMAHGVLPFRFNTPSLTFSARFQGLDWNRQGKGGNLKKTSLQHVSSLQRKNKPVQTPSCCCQSRHIQ